MPYQLTLPDGSSHCFDVPKSILDIIHETIPFLKKKSVCALYNERLIDLRAIISESGHLQVLTLKDPEVLPILRRSFAVLMTRAVESIFSDTYLADVQLTEDGVYCDFDASKPLQESDLKSIDDYIKSEIKRGFTVSLQSQEAAISALQDNPHRHYRLETCLTKTEEAVFFYQAGHLVDFSSLPFVYDFSMLSSFQLLSVAGAYWQGNANNAMHQRIYATVWATPKELAVYLDRRKEMERRDHRLLGRRLDLFHIQDEAPGMVFWHNKGYLLWRLIEDYIRSHLVDAGYQEVKTPQLVDRKLWEESGHWENYGQNMFSTESEKRTYAIKPMNCPCHVQIFNADLRSYRDLPLRMAEFGTCHRNEPSGALHGLMRVRSFVQDDAHIFCTQNQILPEVLAFNQMVKQVYTDFGFRDIDVKLSLRPEKSIGTDAMWLSAENALREALVVSQMSFEEWPGEGAFYGPKIEFHIKDAIGRSWQCGTLQLDFALPERLGASFVDEDNERRVPVMLHRAILGSIERFIGILIEHYAGILPLWLAPVQLSLLTISEKYTSYCQQVQAFFESHGFRCVSDLRSEKIGYKIREHTLLCVPYLLILGEQELDTSTVMLRRRNGDMLGQLSWDECASLLIDEVAQKI